MGADPWGVYFQTSRSSHFRFTAKKIEMVEQIMLDKFLTPHSIFGLLHYNANEWVVSDAVIYGGMV